MNTFFQTNMKAILTLVLCLLILIIIISSTGQKIDNPFSVSKISTPMVDVGDSIKENEIIESEDLALSSALALSNSSENEEAISYGDFLDIYGNKRIQFDSNCRATPSSASFTVGEFVILDNRSDKIQAVRFIDGLYALPPYHVRVFKLERQGIFDIDCGTSKNVAKIIVH
jgi:hypothetical protein